jgi:hypothetical protein
METWMDLPMPDSSFGLGLASQSPGRSLSVQWFNADKEIEKEKKRE